MQGKLIVLDGIDGTGKTGQVKLLLEAFEFAGFKSVTAKLPWKDGSSFGVIESAKAGRLGSLTREAVASLYCINYAEALESIRQEFEKGTHVILQRYVGAIAAHQSSGLQSREDRIAFYKKVENLAYTTFSLPKADLNIILDMGESLAHKNIRKKNSPRQDQSLSQLEKMRKSYAEMAELLPNTKLIKCSQDGAVIDEDVIHNQIWQMVRRLALKI